jgi:hypothetical protein
MDESFCRLALVLVPPPDHMAGHPFFSWNMYYEKKKKKKNNPPIHSIHYLSMLCYPPGFANEGKKKKKKIFFLKKVKI